MNHYIIVATVVLVLLFTSSGSPTAARAGAADGDGVKQLQEFIAAMEKLVVTDPYRPQQTVLARLTAVEDGIEEMGKSEQTAAKSDEREAEAEPSSLKAQFVIFSMS